MVTFRFYVVSTVAFFLALAVGVLVGSVLDGRIADGLQDRLDGVEASLDETVAAIDAKNVQIDEFERYIEASAPFAVQGELEGTSSLVVAETGVDDAGVQDLVRRLRESGSLIEGIVWLEPRWDLAESEDLATAASSVGSDSSDAAEVRAAVWQQLLESSAPPSTATTTTLAPTTVGPDGSTTSVPSTTTTTERPGVALRFDGSILEELADAGLLRLQAIDAELPADGGEMLLVGVTGTASTLAEPGAAVIEMVRTAADAGVPSVLAEVTAPPADDQPGERGVVVAAALDEGSVKFSTVDDLELIAGRVATVLALSALREGTVGRFGYGPDVDGVLPAWQGP